jgi:hypothetical protein
MSKLKNVGVMVLDCSPSMAQSGKVEALVQALKAQLPEIFRDVSRFMVVLFTEEVTPWPDPSWEVPAVTATSTLPLDELVTGVHDMRWGGGTAIYKATALTLQNVIPTLQPDEMLRLTLFTDGEDNRSAPFTVTGVGKTIRETRAKLGERFVFTAYGLLGSEVESRLFALMCNAWELGEGEQKAIPLYTPTTGGDEEDDRSFPGAAHGIPSAAHVEESMTQIVEDMTQTVTGRPRKKPDAPRGTLNPGGQTHVVPDDPEEGDDGE